MIDRRLLFTSGYCESLKTCEISVLAGRGGAFSPKQLQIDVIDQYMKSVDVILTDITLIGTTQFEYSSNLTKLSTSYFSELRDVGLKCFGSLEKHGLVFKFFNPLKEDVKIYIALVGNAASIDMFGK